MTDKNPRTKAYADKIRILADVLYACHEGKMTQKELADQYGLTPQRLCHYLKNDLRYFLKTRFDVTPDVITEALLRYETPSDRILKVILGIPKDTPAYFPEYDETDFYGRYLSVLSSKEREAIILIYGADGSGKTRNFPETGRIMGYTRSYAQELHRKAIRKLQNPKLLYDLFQTEKTGKVKKLKEDSCKIQEELQNLIDQTGNLYMDEIFQELTRMERRVQTLKHRFKDGKHETMPEPLEILIENVDLRTYNALKKARCKDMDDVVRKCPDVDTAMKIKNIGISSAKKLDKFLTEHGYK